MKSPRLRAVLGDNAVPADKVPELAFHLIASNIGGARGGTEAHETFSLFADRAW
jgi:hypothetical protein